MKLKSQVEALNQGQPTLSKLQRKALFWQSHLRNQALEVEFSVMLSDLEPELANQALGPHGHNRSCYQLVWKKTGDYYGFVVTNIKANKSLPLVDCPEYILEAIIPNMDDYLQRLGKYLVDNASYDEDYASDSDEPNEAQP